MRIVFIIKYILFLSAMRKIFAFVTDILVKIVSDNAYLFSSMLSDSTFSDLVFIFQLEKNL